MTDDVVKQLQLAYRAKNNVEAGNIAPSDQLPAL